MLKTSLIIAISFALSSCGNPELDNCTENAGKLWDNSKTAKYEGNNKVYWDAINQCKEKYR